MNKKIDLEMKRLMQRKEELTRELDIVAAGIALLHKVSNNGNEEVLPTLTVAANEAMEAMKRFTRTELAERVKHLYPEMEFNEASVVKPIKQAMAKGNVKLAQPSHGSKKQSLYEWLDK